MKLTTELFATALTAIGGITTVALWGGSINAKVEGVTSQVTSLEATQDTVSRLDERVKAVEKTIGETSAKIDLLSERSIQQTVILQEIRHEVKK